MRSLMTSYKYNMIIIRQGVYIFTSNSAFSRLHYAVNYKLIQNLHILYLNEYSLALESFQNYSSEKVTKK